jgi:flavin-dependent dehydrogenase
MHPETTSDIVILGAGLAGLSLAIHLKKKSPNLSVTVLERESLPYPEATHKVGESTVELAAHYFSEVLGLGHHLKTEQLRKLGTRFFFSEGRNESVESRVELGTNHHLSVPTYQIDRGRFENFLADEARRLGASLIDRTKVQRVDLAPGGGELHTVQHEGSHGTVSVRCRWVIDATGRAALLKRQLGLREASEHDSNAVWFRVKGRVDIDDWGTSPEWRAGHEGILSRWYSTNHLTGAGYWVWLIPLASGYTSIGIVTDPKVHPLSRFRSFDAAMEWLEEHEPQCARMLRELGLRPADYLAIKHYAHKCTRLISGDRWAISGDAGVFIDPLYSPGSDFIAIQNGFIVDTIVRDYAHERFVGRCELYNHLYQILSDNVLGIFRGQYPIFGNPRVMPLKIVWDFTLYWGFLAFITIQGKLCDFECIKLFERAVPMVYDKNFEMQRLFLAANARAHEAFLPGFIEVSRIPFLMELNRGLQACHSDASFIATLHSNMDLIAQVQGELRELLEARARPWRTAAELEARLAAIARPLTQAA